MLCQKLTKNATIPEQKTEFSAGYDICANNNGVIHVNKAAMISTGIAIKIPEGYVGIIKSRSGLSVKYNLEVGAGVIDSDYTGELKVVLRNFGEHFFEYTVGMRIAQLLIIPVIHKQFKVVKSLKETVRGSGGFGSTGMN
jgi:dUTP pyrophosphatase